MIEKQGKASWARPTTLGVVLIVLITAVGCAQGSRDADGSPSKASTASGSNVVKLIAEAPGCDAKPEGTGFAYAPERVMTTAHLVAGTTGPITVIGTDGKRSEGRVVLFDPGRDVAVLRVPGLRAGSLAFGPIDPGDSATLVGYPKGGDLTVISGSIGRRAPAYGQDIYNERQVLREVLIVHAAVEPGVPGAPLFRSDGKVAGMIFASDLDKPSGYALTAEEIARPAMDGTTAAATASTQGCSD
ncbi:S1 family peptidase [Acrocarpospora macrocephala]|uniref:S1 family peptidase n=1 Tax=Acrocarpospora macrocephala TaxID=150177 RepID=UPI0014796C65|nr:serine protease [Acrocarpospora macrocephala]